MISILAHGFGETNGLPLPRWLLACAVGFAVIIAFVTLRATLPKPSRREVRPRRDPPPPVLRCGWRGGPVAGNLMVMVLAHQGGWDEMLFVALPLGLFAFLLYIANKKAQAQLDAEDEQEKETEDR